MFLYAQINRLARFFQNGSKRSGTWPQKRILSFRLFKKSEFRSWWIAIILAYISVVSNVLYVQRNCEGVSKHAWNPSGIFSKCAPELFWRAPVILCGREVYWIDLLGCLCDFCIQLLHSKSQRSTDIFWNARDGFSQLGATTLFTCALGCVVCVSLRSDKSAR